MLSECLGVFTIGVSVCETETLSGCPVSCSLLPAAAVQYQGSAAALMAVIFLDPHTHKCHQGGGAGGDIFYKGAPGPIFSYLL